MYRKYKKDMGSVSSSSSSVGVRPSTGSNQDCQTPSEDLKEETNENVDKSQHKAPVSQDSQAAKDLMISYSHADRDIMTRVKEKLEDSGISVWVDISGLRAGVDFLSKIGQAIIDAKLFISLVSSTSVKSKYCQDELALAYVSNAAIFPVNLENQDTLYPLMDTGMKLQLASYQWVSLVDPDQFDANMENLIVMLKDALELKEKPKEKKDSEQKKDKRPKLVRSLTRQNLNKRGAINKKAVVIDQELSIMPEEFWDKYLIRNTVEWNKFTYNFTSFFKVPLEKTFSADDQTWLIGILGREMEVDDYGSLSKDKYLEFCEIDGEILPLWQRVQDQAIESYAMKDVFNMDSSVRVEAIENLGKFRSSAVIDALRDLLTDSEANVRAVAAVSLARTEANDSITIKQIMKILNDKDRLVREAGCLALGHLQAQQAVKKLLHMWRNDVISQVREAAAVALQQIGGDEVEKAMHVTKVLADEIRQLTE